MHTSSEEQAAGRPDFSHGFSRYTGPLYDLAVLHEPPKDHVVASTIEETVDGADCLLWCRFAC